jgi:hypothetical protein
VAFLLRWFSTTVVSIPMILDRDTDALTAAITSMRVVLDNPGVMVLWGSLITLMVALSLWAWGAGLLVVGPLGHASWHAYRTAVRSAGQTGLAGPEAATVAFHCRKYTLATPNYGYEKRQRELVKKQKKKTNCVPVPPLRAEAQGTTGPSRLRTRPQRRTGRHLTQQTLERGPHVVQHARMGLLVGVNPVAWNQRMASGALATSSKKGTSAVLYCWDTVTKVWAKRRV